MSVRPCALLPKTIVYIAKFFLLLFFNISEQAGSRQQPAARLLYQLRKKCVGLTRKEKCAREYVPSYYEHESVLVCVSGAKIDSGNLK